MKHVYYLGWNRSPAQVGCMRQALGPGALGKPRGSRRRGRWEGGSGWGTHVNPWLFHFNVWQNSLQIKKKKKAKKKWHKIQKKKKKTSLLYSWNFVNQLYFRFVFLLRVMKMFWDCIVWIVAQLCDYTKNHWVKNQKRKRTLKKQTNKNYWWGVWVNRC